MRARIRMPIFLALVLLLLAPACTRSNGSSHPTTGMATLSVRMQDAPIDMSNVQSVNVTLTGVTVFPADSDAEMEVPEPAGELEDAEEGKPIVLLNHPATFDLLTLTGGASVLLGSGEVPAGNYGRIRLDISSAELVYKDGTTAPLKIDSNKVDIPIEFKLTVNQDKSVTLDFDAAASVQVNDTGTGTLILRPVVTPVGD
jgi:uncharacterized protein DUF4382